MKALQILIVLILAIAIFVFGNQMIFDYKRKKQLVVDQSYLPE